MRFGCCYNFNDLGKVEFDGLGLDYLEFTLSGIAALSDDEFEALRERVQTMSVKPEVCNVFFPGAAIPLVGYNVDMDAIRRYCCAAMGRAQSLGVKVLVLGSGAARRIPDGCEYASAKAQFIDVLAIINDVARDTGMTIALEHLNPGETNFITTVGESVDIVKTANLSNIRMLVDFYHLAETDESLDVINLCAPYLVHVHIADPHSRIFPSESAADTYDVWAARIREAGYNGRISIEGSATNFTKQVTGSIKLLRSKFDTEI